MSLFLTITSAVMIATIPGICANVVLAQGQRRSAQSAEQRERVRAATEKAMQDVSKLITSVARTTSGQNDDSRPAWWADEDAIVHRLQVVSQDFPSKAARDRIEMCCRLLSMPHIRPTNEELERWSEGGMHEPETSRDKDLWDVLQHQIRPAACTELLRCIGALRRGDRCPPPGHGLKSAYYSVRITLLYSGDPARKLLPDCPQLQGHLITRALDRVAHWPSRRRSLRRAREMAVGH